MDFKVLLVLACMAAGSLAGPVRETFCASQCNSQGENGIFRAFKTYYYNYDVTIDSKIDGGTSSQTSRIRLQATAAIEGLSSCEMVLKLSDVRISEMHRDGHMAAPERASAFSESLETHSLRFSMESNGTITAVCPEDGEEVRVLNIKRGFLSAIQTKRISQNDVMGQAGLWETDVTGTCMPVYHGEDNVITKTQDYLMCKDRTSLNIFVDAIPVHMMAPTVSPLASQLECRQEMDNQGLMTVECTEVHSLKPFSEADSKPLTSIVTRISRTAMTHRIQSSLGSRFARQTSLLYEDPQTHTHIDSTHLVDTLTRICDSLADGVDSETPILFETLTEQLGQLDSDNMNMIVHRLFRICPEASSVTRNNVINMMKDSLIDCNSEPCIQGFNTIMKTQNPAENDIYMQKWFMKLIFLKNPTKAIINVVQHHITGSSEMNIQAYYALSSLIHRYCLITEDDCSDDDDILSAASIFEDNLNQACQPETEEEVKKMLISLKAIGNMGLIQSKNLLNRCNRDRNPFKIRIAYIEAFRHLSCDQVPTDRFIRIFSTTDNDSELRIAAYRALMRCSSQELLEEVARIMAVEPTHQVTCYVSSHLRNVLESQDPLLQDIQMVIHGSSLANVTQCNMDIRKFSHNFAFSQYSDESGNGIHLDSDVIFSSKSYLPKSLRLAMNVDLFGYGLDLFELETRTEGIQELFESYIERDEEDRERNMVERVKHMMRKHLFRQKRAGVKTASINRIKTKYLQNNVISEVNPEAAVSIRIMDKEVLYKDQDDMARIMENFNRENVLMMIAALTQMRTHEYTVNKNFKPSKATIPTITGMPLEVSIGGAFTSVLKASGKLDIMGMAVTPRRMAVVGNIEPSAAIEIHSHMMVDAHCTRSGLSHKTNMATSLSMGGSLTIENGMLTVNVNAPEKRQTLINASSSLFFMQNNDLVPVSEPADAVITVEESLMDPRYVLHISGSRPNSQFSLPQALFQTWSLGVNIEKIEQSLTYFTMEVGYKTEQAFKNGNIQKVDQFHLLVGAPGSESIGTYLLDLKYHRSNTTLLIRTASPYFDNYFSASVHNESNHKNFGLHVAHNGQDFILQTGLDTIPFTSGVKYVPVFNLTLATVQSFVLEGYLTHSDSGIAIDLSLINKHKAKLVAMRGDFVNNGTMHRLSMSSTLGSLSGHIEAGFDIQDSTGTTIITPIFVVSSSPEIIPPLRLGGSPLVISNGILRTNEIFLASPSNRLIEFSDVHFQFFDAIRCEFQGRIVETIPFGIDFERISSGPVESVTLTTTSIYGVHHIEGSFTNNSPDSHYALGFSTTANGMDYISLTVNFKNKIHAVQYLETILRFRGQQMYRSINGLRQYEVDSKVRYVPIFHLEVNRLGSLQLTGSCDISRNSITIDALTLQGTQDLIILNGSANVNEDDRRVDWNFGIGGEYVNSDIVGFFSHRENTIIVSQKMVFPDGTESPPAYRVTLDLQNSTNEGEIIAWNSKLEVELTRHPELSFRADSQYTLNPGHCSGTVRLCYNGIDCTSSNEQMTWAHELLFRHNKENGTFASDLSLTFSHPAEDRSYSMTMKTDCGRNRFSYSNLAFKNGLDILLNTTVSYQPETPEIRGFLAVTLDIPHLYSAYSKDTWSYSNPHDLFWLSEFRSGEQETSFQLEFQNESGENINIVMQYTDVRNNVYMFQDTLSLTPGNRLHVMTFKENDISKMLIHNELNIEMSDSGNHIHTIHIAKTMFYPVQDISFNATFDMNPSTNQNANVQAQLRFITGQKPITLTAHFINRTTSAKKEGELTTTLSLPRLDITLFSRGNFENGLPSGNVSIKFLPMMAKSTTFGMDLVMNNKSTADSHKYETIVIMKAPQHESYLRHVMKSNKEFVLPLSSTITGAWEDDEVSLGLSSEATENEVASQLVLNIPEHEYLLTHSMSVGSFAHNIGIEKDSQPLLTYNTSIQKEISHAGNTLFWQQRINFMGHRLQSSTMLANLTTSYFCNIEIFDNFREALYINLALDHYPGQKKFDFTSQLRSDYMPGYNSKVKLSFEKTMDATCVNTTVHVDDTEEFSISYTDNASGNSHMTSIIVKQPSHPDHRLREVAIYGTCQNGVSAFSRNATLAWGVSPQTEITLMLNAVTGMRTAATVHMSNPGRVFGLGTRYTLTLSKVHEGFNRTHYVSVDGESGNVFTFESDYKNSSRDLVKNHCVNIILSRPEKDPINIFTTLVHNDGNTVLDADLAISYSADVNQKLVAEMQVTRQTQGHSVVLTLQHLINSIDVSIMGAYSDTSNDFQLSLENDILFMNERYQPEITVTLDRMNKYISVVFTGSGSYEFHGQFTNRSTELGQIYQINCRNVYNGHSVPYEFLFDQQDRLISMKVYYNPDDEADFWELDAGYFNNTALYAQLNTQHSGQLISNASIVLSLTNHKVLTTHIKWEPSWPADLTMFIRDKQEKLMNTALTRWEGLHEILSALTERMNETKALFLTANQDVTNALQLMQRRLGMQLSLIQYRHELARIKDKWIRFTQVLQTNLYRDQAEMETRRQQFVSQWANIAEYFTSRFLLYALEMNNTWKLFLASGRNVLQSFDQEAIAAHFSLSKQAMTEIFSRIFSQLEKDLNSTMPDAAIFFEHCSAICEKFIGLKEKIKEDLKNRFGSLQSDKTVLRAKMDQVNMALMAFNHSLHDAVAEWQSAVQQEVDKFSRPDFSQFASMGHGLKATIKPVLDQLKGHVLVLGAQFLIPRDSFTALSRHRRQAPPSMDLQKIQEVMNRYNGKLTLPTHSSFASAISSLDTEVTTSQFSQKAQKIVDLLEKIVADAYELAKHDLIDGEIIFKIFFKKEWGDLSVLINRTTPVLEMIRNGADVVNIPDLRKLTTLFDREFINQYKQRFQEQFTTNLTHYREIIRHHQTSIQAGVQDAVETQLVPYLQVIGDGLVQRSRPFFSSGFIPEIERHSFFTELTTQLDMPEMGRMFGRMKQQMCGAYNKVTSAVMAFKRATCFKSWIPPYRANALLIGSRHYMTFDQQFYDFSGKCGYLLAKDFVHDYDFSAIVDYERQTDIPIRNMMFIFNSTTFEIKADGTVRVGGYFRELPLQEGATVVLRLGESIVLNNAHGISIVCKLPHDVCVLKLSGRYFDRTGGLLGNFNFEPYDDLKTPDNELQTNITSFTESWKVGKNCHVPESNGLDQNRVISNMGTSVNFDPLHSTNRHCASMFLDNCSPLAQCHSTVDPDAFYRMCVQDTHGLSEEEQKSKMCSIVAAYKTQCWFSGNPFSMPAQCITCELNDGTFGADRSYTIEDEEVPREVDVVFVVEEKRCAESISLNLDGLVNRMAGELKAQGFNDTRFGLAAFGGDGVHDIPHQHTINHKTFTNVSNEFVLGRDSLQFSDGGSNDTFAALYLAANYPFRAGVAKHIILLSCSECMRQNTRLQYSDLSVLLNKRGITFTMLTDYQFTLRNDIFKAKSKSKAQQLYGIDLKSVYTSKMAGQENVKADKTLREFVHEPSNICFLLAQETNGAIFDSSMLGDKGFDEVFVKRIVENSEPSPCQVCHCVPDEMVGIGRSVCEQCTDLANPLQHYIRGGVRDFELKYNLPHMRFSDQIDEEE